MRALVILAARWVGPCTYTPASATLHYFAEYAMVQIFPALR